MSNPCKTDPAIVAVHAANAARRALEKAVDLGHHSDDDFKPYHSAADAADMALLATHADTPRGFAELALYCAEHVIGCEVGVGKSFDDVKAAEGPLGPMVYVAHISRVAAAMIESGIIDRPREPKRSVANFLSEFEDDYYVQAMLWRHIVATLDLMSTDKDMERVRAHAEGMDDHLQNLPKLEKQGEGAWPVRDRLREVSAYLADTVPDNGASVIAYLEVAIEILQRRLTDPEGYVATEPALEILVNATKGASALLRQSF